MVRKSLIIAFIAAIILAPGQLASQQPPPPPHGDSGHHPAPHPPRHPGVGEGDPSPDMHERDSPPQVRARGIGQDEGRGKREDRAFERLHRLRLEAQRILEDEKRLQGFAGQTADNLSEEREERRKKIVQLQQELIDLQKEEYMDQVRETLGHALERIERQKSTKSRYPQAALESMEKRLKEAQDSATDFDTFIVRMREFEERSRSRFRSESSAPKDGDPRVDHIRRELEQLESRIDRLYGELGLIQDGSPQHGPDASGTPPDDMSRFHRGEMPPGPRSDSDRDRPNRDGRKSQKDEPRPRR